MAKFKIEWDRKKVKAAILDTFRKLVPASGYDPSDFVFHVDLFREVGWCTADSEQFYIGRSWGVYDLRKGVE